MTDPAFPANEAERLHALHSYAILDTGSEAVFDDVVSMAAQLCDAPVSLISLVDRDRCWFKANYGLPGMTEAPRRIAYAAHAINFPGETMVITDALTDARFSDCPLVRTDPPMRFYAGTPLVDTDGYALGTLCIIDHKPRQLEEQHYRSLRTLAKHAVNHIEQRRHYNRLTALNQELQRKNEEISEYISFISHDLRQPLRTILWYVDMLQEEHGAEFSPAALQHIINLTATGERMGRMIDHLVSFARLGRHRNRSTFSPAAVLDEVLQDCAAALADGVEVIVTPLPPTVTGYRTEFGQLLQNLVSNALKFTRSGVPARITVAGTEHGDHLRFTVSDNGIGIADRDRPRVFDMFERGSSGERYEGSGLGLAFCRKIVGFHGGSIGVESTEGAGSTFWFTLPKQGHDVREN